MNTEMQPILPLDGRHYSDFSKKHHERRLKTMNTGVQQILPLDGRHYSDFSKKQHKDDLRL
jgi:hypothetical protein